MKIDIRACMLTLIMSVLGIQSAFADFVGGRTDFRDETIYFVMTTRFYDGDPSNNTYCWDARRDVEYQDPNWRGDFKGLIERLDYIKALGFTAIWITPIVQNASGYDYHGYHAMDMSKVEKRLESEDVSFQSLIDAAHARGMKIILDIVINHTGNFGEEHLCKLFDRDYSKPQSDIDQCMIPFTIKDGGKLKNNYSSLPGTEQYSDRLTKMKNTDGVNHDTHNLWHHYGNFNWDEPNRWWAQIAGDCVDLNTENPETYKYLIDCYGTFIKMGVDGFRIDTGGHISRLSFNKAIIPAFLELGEQYKDKRLNECPFYMFAEVCARYSEVTYRNQPSLSPYFYTWQSDQSLLNQWNNNESYWQTVAVYESTDPATLDNQKLCLAEHNANLSESAQPRSNNAKLNGNAYHEPDYSKASGMGVIDFTVHWNFQNAGRVWGVLDKDDFYNDATFNVNYVESHDYGPDSFDRFNGGTDQWAENMSLLFTMRGIPCLFQGGEIEFRKGKVMDKGTDEALFNTGRAYYGGYLTGSVTAEDFSKVGSASGNVAATLSHPLVKHLQRLNQIRAAVPALRKGQYTKTDCSSSGGYAFKRRYTKDGIDSYVLIALNAGATFNNVLNGTYRDCVTGNTITVTDGKLTVPSFSGKGNMRIYVLNGPGKIGEDGPFLYDTNKVSPTVLPYDGKEEAGDPNTKYITGGGGSEPDPDIDDLEVYDPVVESDDEMSVFYEAPATMTNVTLWVWNSSKNFTGGSWPGQDATLMGKTADGTRLIYKWVGEEPYNASNAPTGLIFSQRGQNQTSDLDYRNHGYYIDGVYNRTIEVTGGEYATVSADKDDTYFTSTLTVKLTASEPDAVIVYTTDGTTPTANSSQAVGSVTLTLKQTTTLKAGILADGKVHHVITRVYTLSSFKPHTATIYLKDPTTAPNNWSSVYFYAWDDNGHLTGNWPGKKMTSAETTTVKGDLFYCLSFDINTESYQFNIIFSQGDGGHQTIDITGLNKDTYFEISSTENKYTVRDITSDYSFKLGDVNGDGIIDVGDISLLIDIILGNDDADKYGGRANIDDDPDGIVDVNDLSMLISIVLGAD